MVILIVGDGDFSFTKGIIKFIKRDQRPNIISTCYESYEELIKKYSQASDNICYIKDNGVSVVTNVDATNLSKCNFGCQFNLIIFNFPHVGGKSNIKNNRKLLADFFKSIKESRILSKYGLVCVSLCQGQAGTQIDLKDRKFTDSWQIQEMAARSDYTIYDVRQFDTRGLTDYIPTGFRSQEKRFRLEGARTYVFRWCSVIESPSKLMTTLELSSRKYWIPCWLANCYKRYKGESISLGEESATSLVQSIINEGFSQVEWENCWTSPCCDDMYCLVDVGDGTDSVEATRFLRVTEPPVDVPMESHAHLCSTPWQQVAMMIDKCELNNGGPRAIVAQGECYQRSPGRPRMRYVVAVKELPMDVDGAAGLEPPLPAETFSAENADREIVRSLLARSDIGLGRLERGALRASELQMVSAILTRRGSSRRFWVMVVDISSSIECSASLAGDRVRWGVDADASRALRSVFPTPYVSDEPARVPSSLAGTTERTRLLALQSALEWRTHRDMSFWWDGDAAGIAALLARISEVCRCVFQEHFGGPVELLEQYEPGADCLSEHSSKYLPSSGHRRSLCVRMFLRVRDAPLTKSAINDLQSAVRRHCEHLLGVHLR